MNQPPPITDFTLIDWQSLNKSHSQLLPEHFQQAASLSKSIHLSEQRWQVYLSALAVFGFEQWLQERAPDLRLLSDSASIWQPAYANLMAAACNIQVGDFKICLITASSLTNEHSIPFFALDIPDFAAHFYVLVQVEEEQGKVAVSGFLNYKQYQSYQQIARLQVDKDWTYTLPQTWFNPDPQALLLNLRCLEADAIKLPTSIPTPQNDTVALRKKLVKLESQLQTKYLWKLLTVKEATTLLSNPELVNWVYKKETTSPVQPLINVGLWLRNQIDTAAQELGWMLMPSPVLSGLRSLRGDFEQIRSGLEQQKIHIPSAARGAFRDLESEQGSVRLYAITWVLSETADNPEWMLLVALGPQPEAEMPKTITLEVRDETRSLFEQPLEDTSQGILYAAVIGNINERFWVTVTADNEVVFEIPPFGLGL